MAIYCTALFCCIVCYIILTSLWLRLHGSLLRLIFAIKWWPDHFCWRKYDYFREFWDDLLLMTNLKKNRIFFIFSMLVNQKIAENHMKQQAEADQFESRCIIIFLSLSSTAFPLLCVISWFSCFFDFFNYLLSLWMYIFDRCIISFSLFFIPPIFLDFILFYFIIIFLFCFTLNFVFF